MSQLIKAKQAIVCVFCSVVWGLSLTKQDDRHPAAAAAQPDRAAKKNSDPISVHPSWGATLSVVTGSSILSYT
jgi:hypothetical protein